MSLGPSFVRLAARNTNQLHERFGSLLAVISDTRSRQVDLPSDPPSPDEVEVTEPFSPLDSIPKPASSAFNSDRYDSYFDKRFHELGFSTSQFFRDFDPISFGKYFPPRSIQASDEALLFMDLPTRSNEDEDSSNPLESNSDVALRNLLRALNSGTLANVD
ncbi:hypothetical protein DL96DRAFT_1634678 [Flagelloscypha sp. PMI_526]|nr:hypothetical protein DL96DRAFT_1634678 [Flagelloscypha sp. PMI_526]